MEDHHQHIESFVHDWPPSSRQSRDCFVALWQYLRNLPEGRLEFHARPGVSYSLRGVHRRQSRQPLFVMVDVIDDEPRWLSVCFYGEAVTDPEERGDPVPGGLLGEDGLCFDIEGSGQTILGYVQDRIGEAYGAAT